MIRTLALLVLLAPAVAQVPAVSPVPVPGDRPWNVLLILTDQHHPLMTGFSGNGYGAGVGGSLTRNLDELAEEGVVFERSYCANAQCSPSRYSLLTGRYPHNHGLRWNGIWEPREVATVPELLRDAGYSTATIGKHHLRWLEQPTPLEVDHGFDLVIDRRDYTQYCLAAGTRPYSHPSRTVVMPGLPGSLSGQTGYTLNSNEFHPTGFWADRTIEYLEERAADETPFFCVYSHFGPHTPILPTGPASPEDWAHRYHPFSQLELPPNVASTHPNPRLRSRQAVYGGMTPAEHREVLSYYYGSIAQIDFNIGRVLRRLEALELDENTMVIFTADHGEYAAEFGCWTKGGGAFDSLTRVPLAIRLPAAGLRGVRRTGLVSGVDLAPTILELTGCPVPDEVRAGLDGRSLLPVLVGEPSPRPGHVFSEFGASFLEESGAVLAVRDDGLKLNFDRGFGVFRELFDVPSDPFEQVDLLNPSSPAAQVQAAELTQALVSWWGATADHAPLYRTSGNADVRPTAAADPQPADLALGVDTHADLRWTASSAASYQEVRLGPNGGPLALVDVLPPTVSSFNPGVLQPGATYSWRVDGVNANGPRVGPTWTFRVSASGPGGPGLARLVSPSRDAVTSSGAQELRWAPAADGDEQRIRLTGTDGTSWQASVPGNQGSVSTPPLSAGVQFTWRVSTIDVQGRITAGTDWTFATDSFGLAARAVEPWPAHLSEGFGFQPRLRWSAAAGAAEYRVHLGTEEPLPLLGATAGTEWQVQGLAPATTYFWRVDSVNSRGVRRGWTWRVRTRQ